MWRSQNCANWYGYTVTGSSRKCAFTTAQQSFQIYLPSSLFHNSYLTANSSLQDSYSTNCPPPLSGKGIFPYFILKTPSTLLTKLTYICTFPCHLPSHQEGTSSWKASVPTCALVSISPGLLRNLHHYQPLSPVSPTSPLWLFSLRIWICSTLNHYISPFINNPLSLPWTSSIKKGSAWCLLFTHPYIPQSTAI